MCGPTATWCCGFCLISIFWRVCWNTSSVRTSLISVFHNLHYSGWRETGSPCFISGHFISPSYVMLTDLGSDFWKWKNQNWKCILRASLCPCRGSGSDEQTVALTRLRLRILKPVRIIKMIFLLPIRFADTSGNNLGSIGQAFSSLSMCFTLASIQWGFFSRTIVLLFEWLWLRPSSTFLLTEVKDKETFGAICICYYTRGKVLCVKGNLLSGLHQPDHCWWDLSGP